MNPYAHLKLHELNEEHLACLEVSCAPRGLHLARRGVRRLIDALRGPACVRRA